MCQVHNRALIRITEMTTVMVAPLHCSTLTPGGLSGNIGECSKSSSIETQAHVGLGLNPPGDVGLLSNHVDVLSIRCEVKLQNKLARAKDTERSSRSQEATKTT